MLLVVAIDPDIGTEIGGADDALLVGRAQDGDLRAFAALLHRHNKALRFYVDRLTRNPSDTEDVLQDTALSAWQHLASIREPARVRTWLIQIATRRALKVVNSRPEHDALTEESSIDQGPENDLDRLDVRRSVRQAIDGLPAPQAQAWILRELGGYTYREIAERLNLPESTVRGNLAQARKRILLAIGGAQ